MKAFFEIPIAPEYQYHLKDHLGNVRTTFTTKEEIEEAIATLEPEYENTERSQYLKYDDTRRVFDYLFDHTHGVNTSVPSNTPGYSIRLNGSDTERNGIARSISVMPGDKIDMQVFGKFIDPNTPHPDQTAWNNLLAFAADVAIAAQQIVIDGVGYTSGTLRLPPYTGVLTDPNESTSFPKAHLNWAIFDRNDKFLDGGAKQLQGGAENGTDVLFGEINASIDINEPGYVYIWLSNTNAQVMDVYFDDFKVVHTKSPVVQQDEYYPFGLAFNSYQKENTAENRYLYNQGTGEKTFKTERIYDLGLNVDQSKLRTYDYITGRWWQVDPKADKEGQEALSPYNYSFNNPIRYNDPNGDCIPCITNALFAKYSALMASMSSSSSQGAVTRLMTNSSSTIQQSAGTDKPVTRFDTKAVAKLGDAKIVTDVTAKNSKTLANEVSKDGLTAAQAVGTGIEVAGMGTPISGVGATINAAAGALDEARQVAFEGKSGSDAVIDTGVGLAIDKTFSKLGGAAKTTVGGAEKAAYDKTVSAYEFSFTNLFQWVADKITDNNREKNKRSMNWTNLIIGLFFILFGLIGMTVKSNKSEGMSYSGMKIIYSSYGLIAVGILLVIWSLFFE